MNAEYLSNRQIEVNKVPQGSVPGPTLWNLLYNDVCMYGGVLRLRLPEGTKTVGFADDLALVATANNSYALTNQRQPS